MKIALIARRPCIRLAKQAYALFLQGHDVYLVSQDDGMKELDCFSLVINAPNAKHIEEAVKFLKKEVDLFVVHNEPTWPVAIVKNAAPEKKVILDYHDSIYWYMDIGAEKGGINEDVSWYEEDYCVALADGFTVGSEASRDELRMRTDKPIAVVPPACLRNDFRYQPLNFVGGLAVQGGHSVPGNYTRVMEHWRDYTKLYTFLKGKCHVFVYSPAVMFDPECPMDKHYKNLVTGMTKVPYADLLNRLGEHTWNLVGNWIYHQVWKYSAPNKFYDAIAAGVPSIVFNIKSVTDIIKEEGFGIVVEHPQEILDRWDEQKKCRAELIKKREKYCMDNFIGRAVDLYTEVLRG